MDIVTIDGHHFLSIIDYGCRFPELLDLSSTTTSDIIDKLMEVFARFGVLASLVSYNGPQFASSEMAAFLKQLNIRHIKSSPRYPRSNGMVERFHRLVRDRLAVATSRISPSNSASFVRHPKFASPNAGCNAKQRFIRPFRALPCTSTYSFTHIGCRPSDLCQGGRGNSS